MNIVWTDENTAKLREMWAAGDSATVIAEQLGGVSRNAVIGKIARLRNRDDSIERRPNPATAGRPPKSVKVARLPRLKPKPVKIGSHPITCEPVVADVLKLEPLNLTLVELERCDCRWPVDGEKELTLFCGHRQAEGSSYCEYHKRAARGRGTVSERNVMKLSKVFF